MTVKDFSHQVPLKVNGLMYRTPTKACENVDMAGSRPYTRNGCEQRRENVGWGKGSLVRANSVTILEKSEICT